MGKPAVRSRGAAVPMRICSSNSKSAQGLIQEGVGIPRSQMLLDPAFVLGLPGQSLDQVMDKMQGDVHFLVLTTSAS